MTLATVTPGNVLAVLLAVAIIGVLAYYTVGDWLSDRRARAEAKQDAWDAHWLSVEQAYHQAIAAADGQPDVMLADDFRLWQEAADWFGERFARELADIRALPVAEPTRELRL